VKGNPTKVIQPLPRGPLQAPPGPYVIKDASAGVIGGKNPGFLRLLWYRSPPLVAVDRVVESCSADPTVARCSEWSWQDDGDDYITRQLAGRRHEP